MKRHFQFLSCEAFIHIKSNVATKKKTKKLIQILVFKGSLKKEMISFQLISFDRIS